MCDGVILASVIDSDSLSVSLYHNSFFGSFTWGLASTIKVGSVNKIKDLKADVSDVVFAREWCTEERLRRSIGDKGSLYYLTMICPDLIRHSLVCTSHKYKVARKRVPIDSWIH